MNERSQQLSPNDLQMHWIWFREKGFYLPDKILVRAKSWIELNPTLRFQLWTNLVDVEEPRDFISQLNEDHQKLMMSGRIEIKYQSDLCQIVEQFCHTYLESLRTECDFLHHLYCEQPPVINAITQYTTTPTHHTMTTTIQTELQNTYKINRIFRVDLLRIIVLCLCGGLYSDFNDTICFYPMKYFLTMYRGEYLPIPFLNSADTDFCSDP
jgi:hypothetical protein